MPDFNVRSDSVNVEQVMEQIRARIREKRGVDYTEQQIKELAAVKLEKFLDPRGVRSDLLAEFRKSQPPPEPYTVPLYAFEDSTLFDSRRPIVRFIRRMLRPLLKLVFNANALSQSLHQQAEINRQSVERFDRLETSLRQTGDLYYELLHNLVVELTRTTIEVKNMKMRVESIASRLEFNERRARALESVVVYKPSGDEGRRERQEPPQRPESLAAPTATPAAAAVPQAPGTPSAGPQHPTQPSAAGEGPGQRSRRRRRRRGRRGGPPAAVVMGVAEATASDAPSTGDAPAGAEPTPVRSTPAPAGDSAASAPRLPPADAAPHDASDDDQ
jgi:hypothetical protein